MQAKNNNKDPLFITKNNPMPSILAILLFCSLANPSSGHAGHAEMSPATTAPAQVKIITVHKKQLASRVEVVGTVQAADRAVIAAKISGAIVELPVVLGSRVHKGDLLVKINAQEISARVLQAEAQLAQARRNLRREEKLLQQHASTPETVKSMRDMLAIASAGYHEAASMFSYATITAPFSGVITKKIANTGDLATPGMPLLHLEDDSHLQVITAIPEASAPEVKLREQLQVTIPTIEKTVSGEIAEISPAIDPRSRTMPVKINLTDTRNLRTGMFARVALPGRPYMTLMIPKSAIVPFGQLNKVFVVDGTTARLRLVRTGLQENDLIEILSGLTAGERVIVGNNRLLISGQEVAPSNEGSK